MHKAIRSQADDLGDAYSEATMLICKDRHRAREEHKDDADTNILLRRFGVGVPHRGPGVGAEVDYTTDLTDAYVAAERAREAWWNVPKHLRDKYSSWEGLAAAIQRGEVGTKDVNVPPIDIKSDSNDTTGSTTNGATT